MAYIDNQSWGRILAEAWLDSAFKDLLEKDPAAAVQEFAKRYPQNPLPPYDTLSPIGDRPTEFTDEELKKIAEGTILLHYVVPASTCC